MNKKDIIVEEEIDVNIPEATLELGEEVQKTIEENASIVSGAEESPKQKSFSKKILLTAVFVLVNAVAIMATALMDFGGQNEVEPFSSVWHVFFVENWNYALIALLLFFVALCCEGMKRYVLLRASLKHRKLFFLGLGTATVSKYYDFITPMGSGGQPMEIYFMRKKGVPGAIATGISITSYALGLFATVFLTLIMVFWKGFLGVSTAIKVLAIIGLVANIFVPMGILIFSISPKVGDFIARAVAKILGFFHLAKNTESIRAKAVDSIKEYARCITYFFGKYRYATFLVFVFGLVYNFAIYSIPYFIIRMCGVSADDINYFEVFTLCLICFSSITIFPTPGNSGAAEISFYSIFSSYLATLGAGVLFWGVLSWRIATYYLFIVCGVVVMIVERLIGRRQGRVEFERREPWHSEISSPQEEEEGEIPMVSPEGMNEIIKEDTAND